jgi:MPBQ/MSBQ methyltransferase
MRCARRVLAVPERADVVAHYGRGSIVELVCRAVAEAGLPSTGVEPERLAPLDHFHTGGRAATEELLAELLALLDVGPATTVLDVGAGLGGPARLLAHRRGCRVTCLDLTPDFCAAARLLTAMTGLSELVDVREGDATRMPFPDHSFDVVWMQNSSMNIADKARLFGEVHRVLRPGGCLALQEVAAGEAGLPVLFPVMWADTASLSFLVEPDTLRRTLSDVGLVPRTWADVTAWALAQPQTQPSADTALGFHVYVRDAAVKRANSRRSMQEGRCILLRVTAIAT